MQVIVQIVSLPQTIIQRFKQSFFVEKYLELPEEGILLETSNSVSSFEVQLKNLYWP